MLVNLVPDFLAVLAAPALSRPTAAVRALAFLATGGVALSAYAIFARARFGTLLYGRLSVPTVSPFGPFVSKNHFAGWMGGPRVGRRGHARHCGARLALPRRDGEPRRRDDLLRGDPCRHPPIE